MLKKILPLILFVFIINQAVAQNVDKLTKITTGVYTFGSGAISLAIVTDSGVVVIDPASDRQAKAMDAALSEVTDHAVTHVLYSHNHWDHISGAEVFTQKGALVLSHIETKAHIKPHPSVVTPDLVWSGNRFDLTVGDTTIELHHFGPSHGKGMTVFRLPEQKLLFQVDIATAGRVFPMFMPDFDIDGLVATLDAIQNLDFDMVVFGHGRSSGGTKTVGDKADIAEVSDYLDDLIGGVRGAIATGGFQAVTNLELPKWKHLNMYDEWFNLNATRIVISMTMGH